MNLLVISDKGGSLHQTSCLLSEVNLLKSIKSVFYFTDENDYPAEWAHDFNISNYPNKIDFSGYSIENKYGASKWYEMPNSVFRGVVDDFNIDAFLFIFNELGKEKPSDYHQRARNFYRRANKAFRKQIIFTNKKLA